VTASQYTRARQLSVSLLAAAAVLTACGRTVPGTAPVVPETLTSIGRPYAIESHELIEIRQLEDGSMKYMPTGWIVVAPSTTTTASTGVGDHTAQP
jgi:hypothetical protein